MKYFTALETKLEQEALGLFTMLTDLLRKQTESVGIRDGPNVQLKSLSLLPMAAVKWRNSRSESGRNESFKVGSRFILIMFLWLLFQARTRVQQQ